MKQKKLNAAIVIALASQPPLPCNPGAVINSESKPDAGKRRKGSKQKARKAR